MGRDVLRVFDKPMCCTSGVCGPEPDAELVEFAADVEWLRRQGVMVERFNPAQEPGVFTTDPVVRRALQERGSGSLPLLLWGDQVIASGGFPGRSDLVQALDLQVPARAGGVR